MKLLLSIICTLLCHTYVYALEASWYDEASLKREGTWAYSKGVMANGQIFNERLLTAASRDYPLGTRLEVSRVGTQRKVVVVVTDRCNKRFKGKRIDLSKRAFMEIADCKQGIVQVKVKEI